MLSSQAIEDFEISIHALREEGDVGCPHIGLKSIISIHALREEGDVLAQGFGSTLDDFYPRPPRGGRPCSVSPCCIATGNFYPRPPRGGRPCRQHQGKRRVPISIHALREEGDATLNAGIGHGSQFLSTPSARRATAALRRTGPRRGISIHALREEGDLYLRKPLEGY